MARLLIVEDDPGVRNLLVSLLTSDGHEVEPVGDGAAAMDVFAQKPFDLVLSDVRMKPIDGIQLLRHIHEGHPRFPVIMMTAYGKMETAVEAMKMGAFDYIAKPFKVDELLVIVQRALEFHQVLNENAELKARLGDSATFEGMVAVSAAMRNVCEMVARVAPGDSTVLIEGESGTGKELVAKSVHNRSNRKSRRFIAINCAALPEPLLESELFGHVKGAFTGATADKEGLFQAADRGTLFLDEIGGMPMSLQGKLLRVLEEHEVRRVGDTVSMPVDVRVLAATNERLEDQVRQGKFRDDLFYRLNVVTIDLPPLRERREDILPLVEHLLKKVWAGGEPYPEIAPEAELLLEAYRWPGNVRELENAIRHACTFLRDDRIGIDILPARIVHAVRSGSTDDRLPIASRGSAKSLKAYVRDCEQAYIRRTLAEFKGDKRKVAEELKVSLATLYRKLPELDE